jgi:DNA-3-methyladenine glycosylase
VQRFARSFFERYTPLVARQLLGSRLVRVDQGRRMSGTIVETEAYRGSRDPASHAYRGRTRRNEVMYGPAGHAYVYFTMGAHFCLNITTEEEGKAGAILVRAIQPSEGIERMKRNRGVEDVFRLASGPGNLTRALKIDRNLNGEDVITSKRLFIEPGERIGKFGVSSRVGIRVGTSFKWRFYAQGNPFVSRGRPSG